jgi:hypothetical protein
MADYGDMLGRKDMSFKGADGGNIPVVFNRGGPYQFAKLPDATEETVAEQEKPKVKRSYKAVFGKPYIASPSEIEKLHD